MALQNNKMNDGVSRLKSCNCGTITCIFNVNNNCYETECEFLERGFKKEED